GAGEKFTAINVGHEQASRIWVSVHRYARRRWLRLREPVHFPAQLPREVVDVTPAALQHRDAAVARRYDDPGHAVLAEGLARPDLLVTQDQHRGRPARGLDHQVRHVVAAEPAALRVHDLIGSEVEPDTRSLQRMPDLAGAHAVAAQPA